MRTFAKPTADPAENKWLSSRRPQTRFNRTTPSPSDQLEQSQGAIGNQATGKVVNAVTGPSTTVDGVAIDQRYCDCDFKVQRALAWTQTMVRIFEQCNDEVIDDNNASEAVLCKERKLREMGIATESAGSVDLATGEMYVEKPEGLCGPIIGHGYQLHESVHERFFHKKARQLESDGAEVSFDAGEYSRNEIRAYKKEARFLRRALRALHLHCKGTYTMVSNPDYYREACAELDLDLGLDRPFGSGFSRPELNEMFPKLKAECWWYLGEGGGGYNCFGYCLQSERGLEVVEPATSDEDLLATHGYYKTDDVGQIALYDGGHVAYLSEYTFHGEQLWESKLGQGGPLILHKLRGLEGNHYGSFIGYYSRTDSD